MGTQDAAGIAKSIRTINHELGLVWRAIEGIQTDMGWIKRILWQVAVPLMVSTVLLVLGILLKLLWA